MLSDIYLRYHALLSVKLVGRFCPFKTFGDVWSLEQNPSSGPLRSPSCWLNHLDTPEPGNPAAWQREVGLGLLSETAILELMLEQLNFHIMSYYMYIKKKYYIYIYTIGQYYSKLSDPASTLKSHRTSMQYLKPSFSMILRAPTFEVSDDRCGSGFKIDFLTANNIPACNIHLCYFCAS